MYMHGVGNSLAGYLKITLGRLMGLPILTVIIITIIIRLYRFFHIQFWTSNPPIYHIWDHYYLPHTIIGGTRETQAQAIRFLKVLVEERGREIGKIGPGDEWSVPAASIDKDTESKDALHDVWPDIFIIYCLWHLLRWLWSVMRRKDLNIEPVSTYLLLPLQHVILSVL